MYVAHRVEVRGPSADTCLTTCDDGPSIRRYRFMGSLGSRNSLHRQALGRRIMINSSSSGPKQCTGLDGRHAIFWGAVFAALRLRSYHVRRAQHMRCLRTAVLRGCPAAVLKSMKPEQSRALRLSNGVARFEGGESAKRGGLVGPSESLMRIGGRALRVRQWLRGARDHKPGRVQSDSMALLHGAREQSLRGLGRRCRAEIFCSGRSGCLNGRAVAESWNQILRYAATCLLLKRPRLNEHSRSRAAPGLQQLQQGRRPADMTHWAGTLRAESQSQSRVAGCVWWGSPDAPVFFSRCPG